MINGMTLMLYVKNVNRAANFWSAIGFDELVRIPLEGSESVVLTCDDFGNVTIQLYELDFVRQNSPELVNNQPTILFSTDNIEEAHEAVKKVTKRVDEITAVEDNDFTFTFYDLDGQQFAIRGEKVVESLSQDAIDTYFENLSGTKLISARDVEFLPEKSFIFFGQVTDEKSRAFAPHLAPIKREIYYVDTELAKISSDLRLILQKYDITEIPAFIRRNTNGRAIQFDSESEDVDSFITKL